MNIQTVWKAFQKLGLVGKHFRPCWSKFQTHFFSQILDRMYQLWYTLRFFVLRFHQKISEVHCYSTHSALINIENGMTYIETFQYYHTSVNLHFSCGILYKTKKTGRDKMPKPDVWTHKTIFTVGSKSNYFHWKIQLNNKIIEWINYFCVM
jgi:hypothetical protein